MIGGLEDRVTYLAKLFEYSNLLYIKIYIYTHNNISQVCDKFGINGVQKMHGLLSG